MRQFNIVLLEKCCCDADFFFLGTIVVMQSADYHTHVLTGHIFDGHLRRSVMNIISVCSYNK